MLDFLSFPFTWQTKKAIATGRQETDSRQKTPMKLGKKT
jgi:hypothetical protein